MIKSQMIVAAVMWIPTIVGSVAIAVAIIFFCLSGSATEPIDGTLGYNILWNQFERYNSERSSWECFSKEMRNVLGITEIERKLLEHLCPGHLWEFKEKKTHLVFEGQDRTVVHYYDNPRYVFVCFACGKEIQKTYEELTAEEKIAMQVLGE